MSKYEDANLILKLYEMRREEVMRQARNWMITFNPTSAQEIMQAILGPNSAYFRMVTTYWDMAASFVNNGAVDEQMFNDANGEHVVIFSKIQPYLAEFRELIGSPNYLAHLEKLVMRLPDAEERLENTRERMKRILAAREEMAKTAQA
jgi:hypothetical protein